MKLNRVLRLVCLAVAIAAAGAGVQSLRTQAAPGGAHCQRGIKSCSASQVGQPCNPNNPGIICSAQADGSYCCLAYAP
ncbi:MAG TPA: hypothetical protein VFV19_17250 [Candidatus Polarisedimenticolaceae bacterium]|nr:hypothetical protein [Candidatus Polarisedimenticolaceae bacterium]